MKFGLGLMALLSAAGCYVADAHADESVAGAKTGVKVDWIVDGGYTTNRLTGSEPAYKTLVNEGDGLYLTRLSLLAHRPNGRIDEFRVDLSGFGASSGGAADISLTKYSWYRLDLRHHETNSFVDAPGLALGQHGQDSRLTDSGGVLTLFPVGPVRLNMGFGRTRYDATDGTTFATTADEFALNNSLRRRSDSYQVGLNAGRGPMHVEGDYVRRNYSGRETISLPQGSQSGNNPDDLAVLKAFSSVQPVDGISDRVSGTIQWLKGPVQVRAQYIRTSASEHAATDQSDSETTLGGARKDVTQTSNSRSARDVDYGKVLARWRVARPLAIKLTFWSGRDVTDGSDYLHRAGISVGVPIVVDSNSLTRAEVTQKEGNVGVELGSFGPLSFDLAGGGYTRSIRTDGLTSGGVPEAVDQTGTLLRGGIIVAKNGWRIRGNRENRTVDHPYTDAGARREDRSDLDVRYRTHDGFYAEGKGSRTSWNDRAGGRSADALTLSAGFDGTDLLVSGGYAWLDAQNRIAVLGENGDVPYDLADLFSEGSMYLDAEWNVAPNCRIDLHANRFETTGAFGCRASRVEPRLNVKFGKTWFRLGLFRDDYIETTPGGRNYRTDGVTVGATIVP